MSKSRAEDEAARALSLMEQALALLDQAEFAPQAGADLDHAICRLRDALENRRSSGEFLTDSPFPDAHPWSDGRSVRSRL
jgi:hypothetical protein